MDKTDLIYRESNGNHDGQVIEHFITEQLPGEKVKTFSIGGHKSFATTNGILSSLYSFFKSAFLPQNFPHSVSQDYLDYQLWDSVQAFASSISGSLATQVSYSLHSSL